MTAVVNTVVSEAAIGAQGYISPSTLPPKRIYMLEKADFVYRSVK